MLEPRGKGIVLWTLRYGDEVRDPDDYFERIGPAKADAKLLDMVTTMIEERTKPWDPGMVDDPVQARLLEIVASKKKGQKRPKKKATDTDAPASNVVNIMDALRKSISSERNK